MLLLATLAVGVLAQPWSDPPLYEQNYPDDKCIYTRVINGYVHYWDLRPLSRKPGQEYTLQDPSGNWWAFNVCGQVSYPCIPDGWVDPFSHGDAHQYLEGTPQSATTPGGVGCKSTATDPATGQQACTSQCIMASHGYPEYDVLNITNPQQGIAIWNQGVRPDAGSPFACPYDPRVPYTGSRSLTFYLQCDPSQTKAGLENVYIDEVAPCEYFVQATTAAACPQLFPLTPSPSATPSVTSRPTSTATRVPTPTASEQPAQAAPPAGTQYSAPVTAGISIASALIGAAAVTACFSFRAGSRFFPAGLSARGLSASRYGGRLPLPNAAPAPGSTVLMSYGALPTGPSAGPTPVQSWS